MFNKKLKAEKLALEEKISELKTTVRELESNKKIEEEDLKHMIRLKEERLAVQFQRKELEIEAEKEKAVAAVKDEYRDKLEARLSTEVNSIKEMYGQILERLPNVNMRGKL